MENDFEVYKDLEYKPSFSGYKIIKGNSLLEEGESNRSEENPFEWEDIGNKRHHYSRFNDDGFWFALAMLPLLLLPFLLQGI